MTRAMKDLSAVVAARQLLRAAVDDEAAVNDVRQQFALPPADATAVVAAGRALVQFEAGRRDAS